GWPDKTEDFENYYPTSTLVTGYDIIPFWVMRMMFSGIEHTGQVPFDTVLIHGLVRDAQGRKMSKSLGNGIDPLEIIDKYGADALRFTLATGNSPGNDMRFSDDKVEASRNFANKIWNAARFILMNLSEDEPAPHIPDNLAIEDKWILSVYEKLVRDVTENLEKFELGMAVAKLYDFIWDIFCDWYIEIAKIRLQKDDESKNTAKAMLVYIFSGALKLLHPFMPFITEEIWQTLPHEGESIMISEFPVFDETLVFEAEEKEMDKIMTAIRAVRNRRAEMNVAPSKKAKVFVETQFADTFEKAGVFMQKLASASEVEVGDKFDIPGAVSIITEDARMYIPLDELVDLKAEKARLEKELAATKKELDFVNNKLGNPNFVSKAPEQVVQKQREAAVKLNDKIKMLQESIDEIK
ncbi:MAG: class I tRNA ligase family protein, partial [Clostridia bacterium]|nr:class I tRNA ligase family protein [Clostridia bacterium]